MPLLTNLISALAMVINAALTLFFWAILIRVLLSWVSPDPFNPLVQTLYRITDPVLRPVQRVIPPLGGLDLSPIVVLVALEFLRRVLIGSLHQLTYGF